MQMLKIGLYYFLDASSIRKSLITSVLFSFVASTLLGQIIKVETTLDTNKILIGDQIHLTYSIEKPKSIVVDLPLFKDSICKGIEVLTKPQIDTIAIDNNNEKLEQKILITSFDSGNYLIPEVPFIFSYEGRKDTITSPVAFLQVYTIPVDTSKQIYDIKGQYKVPVTLQEILKYSLLVLLAIVLVAALIYIIVKLKRKEPLLNIKSKPMEPPHIIALRELDKLKTEKLWQQNRIKEYYIRLTEVLRIYIENRYNVKALEQTTDEILNSLRMIFQLDTNPGFKLLDEILNLGDLVKFAKTIPTPDENEFMLRKAYDFVEHTKQIELVDDPVSQDNQTEKTDE